MRSCRGLLSGVLPWPNKYKKLAPIPESTRVSWALFAIMQTRWWTKPPRRLRGPRVIRVTREFPVKQDLPPLLLRYPTQWPYTAPLADAGVLMDRMGLMAETGGM
jgi:hypothetical protein